MKQKRKQRKQKTSYLLPNHLEDLFDETLLLLTGRQQARLYLIDKSEMRLLDEFLIPTPKYSDREGHFKTRGAGKTIRSGAVYENKKDKILIDFVHVLEQHLTQITHQMTPKELYLFTPAFMRGYVISALSKRLQQKVVGSFQGNFMRNSPLSLLEKIYDETQQHRVKPVTPEVHKILRRPLTSRH